ncbi:hypothetical protein GCM10023148_36490 [Actinokineospora soli]
MLVRDGAMVVVGRISDAQDGWRVERAVDPDDAPATALRVGSR